MREAPEVEKRLAELDKTINLPDVRQSAYGFLLRGRSIEELQSDVARFLRENGIDDIPG